MAAYGSRTGDLNNLVGSGLFYVMSDPAHAPNSAPGEHWYVIQIVCNDDWKLQIAAGFDGAGVWMRTLSNKRWGAWRQL